MSRFFLLSLALLGVSLRAHDAGLSTARMVVGTDKIEVTVAYAAADARVMLPGYDGPDPSKNAAELAQRRAPLEELALILCTVKSDGKNLVPLDSRVELVPGDNVAFHYTFPRLPGMTSLVYAALNLPALPSSHREHFQAFDTGGKMIAEKMLSAREPDCPVNLSRVVATAPLAPRSSFHSFFILGVEHIWTGYDHLLFLLALLLVCRGWRSILTIVTCFTVAHSLTLSLAALNWVNLPPVVVEPLIAASIVFVALENLWLRGKDADHRGWLTFGFGLVHGFGFASVLRDLGVGTHGEGVIPPLFSFNLGVETGQVCVAAVVLPVLNFSLRDEKVRRIAVPAASTVVAAAGLYWLAERTILA